MNKFTFLATLNNKNKLLFQPSKTVLLNETATVSNREVFDYEQKDSFNGKSITNIMINKTVKNAQTGKENINITDTD